MADHVERLQDKGTRVAIIGPGSQEQAAQLSEQVDGRLTILADPDNTVHPQFGFDRVFLGLMQQSGTVLIDRHGTVRHVHAAANPTASLHLEDIEAVLDSLD